MWKQWIDRMMMGLLVGLLAMFIMNRLPGILKQWDLQGSQVASALNVVDLSGMQIDLGSKGRSKVLIFWATWCGPCTIELDRLKTAVAEGEIPGEAIWAVNLGEEEALVRSVVAERGYSFQVVRDVEGVVADQFDVSVTPTVVFLSEDRRVEWMTSGISPTLVMRIKKFLSSTEGLPSGG